MDTRTAYLRQNTQRARLQKRLAAAAMFGASACAAFVLLRDAQGPDQPAVAMAIPTPATQAQAEPAQVRRIYPYSIVPGGLASRAELARAVTADRVAAAHYAGFAVDRATLRTVAKARAVYVSYRKGGQVYWTARKMTLAAGETVLSDGQNELRARCGNRISDTPQLPVEVKGPGEQELDTPLEQTRTDADGALREVAFEPDEQDEQDREGRRFALQSFPNGAGLIRNVAGSGSQVRGSLDSSSSAGVFDANRRPGLLASLASPGFAPGVRTTSSIASSDYAAMPAGEAGAAANGGMTFGSGSTGNAGDTGSAGRADIAGDTGGGKPPAPGLRADPPADSNTPAKPHELPEPGSAWLTGLAAAALLLQRRLRARHPR